MSEPEVTTRDGRDLLPSDDFNRALAEFLEDALRLWSEDDGEMDEAQLVALMSSRILGIVAHYSAVEISNRIIDDTREHAERARKTADSWHEGARRGARSAAKYEAAAVAAEDAADHAAGVDMGATL